jgi:hypothetical protein
LPVRDEEEQARRASKKSKQEEQANKPIEAGERNAETN